MASTLRHVGWNDKSFQNLSWKPHILNLPPNKTRPVPRDRDENSGEFQEVYSHEEILSLLEGTRLATSEVADKLGCHRTTAHEKLKALEEAGELEADSVGNTFIWSVREYTKGDGND